jgi:histidinol-phosphate/aromatic aminotransferase/cobyric acid decarboxylase-like protein
VRPNAAEARLAEVHNKKTKQILVGAGANAILEMAAAFYLGPKKKGNLGANISFAANAAVGSRNITVTNTDGQIGKLTNGFTIGRKKH